VSRQHRAALGDPHAPLVRHVGVPDRVLRVDTYAVRRARTEIGPDPSAGQPAVRADVEGQQGVPVGVRDDQGGVVGGHRHLVRERDVVGHFAHRAVGRDQDHDARLELVTGRRAETGAVDVGTAVPVHHNVVPARPAQVRVGDQGSVGLPAQQPAVAG